jgi:phosphosulfolactate synthase (CoM biosynthesis protein A)
VGSLTEGVDPPRIDLISEIVGTFDIAALIFQAKDSATQEMYVRRFGPEVSLDVEDDQAVALELLRRGIRKSALAGLSIQEVAGE